MVDKDPAYASMPQNKLKLIILACASLSGLAGLAVLTSAIQPNSSPLRQDVLTLRNDVGEKIVLPKSTIRPLPKEAKSLMNSLANDAKTLMEEAGTPVTRDSSLECASADASIETATRAESHAREWQGSSLGSSLFEMYQKEASDARSTAAQSESKCQKDLAEQRAERKRILSESQASKELIRIAASPRGFLEVVPTYEYKILITDVNGKSRVILRQTTCLNKNAISLFSQQQRKQIAPYGFVNYEKPENMAIVTDAVGLGGLVGDAGSTLMPTEDATNYAAQILCKFKGHRAIEETLGKA